MGHIINATAFRLGKTQRTSSIWVRKNPQYKSFFLKDLYISRFLKNFFITYNIPVFLLYIFVQKIREKMIYFQILGLIKDLFFQIVL